MITKPVDKVNFWRKRISSAVEFKDWNRAVFETKNWPYINECHEEILLNYISVTDDVLDAGCGFGRAVDFIPFGRYTGVDFVPEFILEAQERHPRSDVSFDLANLQDLPYLSSHFDWVVGISLEVMIINNLGWGKWDKIRQELLRVSRNGVICLEYTDPEVYNVIKKL